jgi:hypothetical protein
MGSPTETRGPVSSRSIGRGLVGFGVLLLLIANLASMASATGPGGGNAECEELLPGSFFIAKFNVSGGEYVF